MYSDQLPKKYENLVYYCKPTLDLVCDLWDSDFWCLNFLARKKKQKTKNAATILLQTLRTFLSLE